MAGRSTRRPAAAPCERVAPNVVAALAQRVRSEGAVMVKSLGLGKLTKGATMLLAEDLARLGVEHTGRMLRQRLGEQLQAYLRDVGPKGADLKTLTGAVKGAARAAETRTELEALASAGVAVPVVKLGPRPTTQWALAGPHLLSTGELDVLLETSSTLAQLAKAAQSSKSKRAGHSTPRPTIARATLSEPIAALSRILKAAPGAPPSATHHPEGANPDARTSCRASLETALRTSTPHGGLIEVSTLVGDLEKTHRRAQLVHELENLAREGLVELRPYSAVRALSAQERERCPTAIDGTPLFYCRWLGAHQGEQP